MTDYPLLRYGVEGFPVEHDGKEYILLRDRLGYNEDSLLVSAAAAELLMHMNGENSLRDLQAHYLRTTGQLLYTEDIKKLVERLDDHLLLDNERFRSIVHQETARYRDDPVRRMQFAGKSYPEDPDALRSELDGCFTKEAGGPRIPDGKENFRPLVALVAPHIDIQAGGSTFAYAYKALREAISPKTWVILGTGHDPVENYFALTIKDFETPLGIIPSAREYCEELVRLAPRDILKSEYNHRKEHSVEFQTVFLAHTQPGAQVVPLLCSFSIEDWESDKAYIDGFALLLRDLARSAKHPVGFIASVDLAHIGPRYGQQFRPHSGTIAQHSQSDRDLLESLVRCDPLQFMEKIRRERNRRQICGVAPLYVLAKILEGNATGEILHHAHTIVDDQNSFVTFASMAFYSDGQP